MTSPSKNDWEKEVADFRKDMFYSALVFVGIVGAFVWVIWAAQHYNW
jgi:hypothetical protein